MDGFGVGWYAPEADVTPGVFTSCTPAWNNRNLHRLAEKIVSPLVFAHVRAATTGVLADTNCHPFRFGRYLFMHNGGVGAFSKKIKRNLVNSLNDVAFGLIEGTTDSEHIFALFINQFPPGSDFQHEQVPASILLDYIAATLEQLNKFAADAAVEDISYLNFAVTDGESVVATRYVSRRGVTDHVSPAVSLYYTSGTEVHVEGEECVMQRHDKRQSVVVIASEPLWERHDWLPVPGNSVMVITSTSDVLNYPVDSLLAARAKKNATGICLDIPEADPALGGCCAAIQTPISPIMPGSARALKHEPSDIRLSLDDSLVKPLVLAGLQNHADATVSVAHTLVTGLESVLCLAQVSRVHVCGGMDNGQIAVMSLENFSVTATLRGHTSSVLSLCVGGRRPYAAPATSAAMRARRAAVRKMHFSRSEPVIDVVTHTPHGPSLANDPLNNSPRAVDSLNVSPRAGAEATIFHVSSPGFGKEEVTASLRQLERLQGLSTRSDSSTRGTSAGGHNGHAPGDSDRTSDSQGSGSRPGSRGDLPLLDVAALREAEPLEIVLESEALDTSGTREIPKPARPPMPARPGSKGLDPSIELPAVPREDELGERLVWSASADACVRVWDVTDIVRGDHHFNESERCVAVLSGTGGDVYAVWVCEERRVVAVGCKDMNVRLLWLDGILSAASRLAPARGGPALLQMNDYVIEGSVPFCPLPETPRPFVSPPFAPASAAHSPGAACIGLGLVPKPGTHPDDEAMCAKDPGGRVVCAWTSGPAPPGPMHAGHVYALAGDGANLLYTGAGDGSIRAWRQGSREPVHELWEHTGAVLTLCAYPRLRLYSGGRDKTIKVWDISLPVPYCTRTLSAHTDAVLTLACTGTTLISGSADGQCIIWDALTLQCRQTLSPLNGGLTPTAPVLSVCIVGSFVCVGGPEEMVVLERDTSFPSERTPHTSPRGTSEAPASAVDGPASSEAMIESLRRFVAFPSVSGESGKMNACLEAAKYIQGVLQALGADSRLVDAPRGPRDYNPLVLARLGSDPKKNTVLFYGHYDVQPAKKENGWIYDPFVLTSRDGYLLGRGATDDKGPIIAFIQAVKELLEPEGSLPVNIVFCLEGEEENGSGGFQAAIRANLNFIGRVDLVLVSNAYWIGNETPCLNYGLRGVIHAMVTITGPTRDLHSGVDGGVIHEPLGDLLALMAHLREHDGSVKIPGFYSAVAPMTDVEEALYNLDEREFDVEKYQKKLGVTSLTTHSGVKELLIRRWRTPTLTVHKIVDSFKGAAASVIPREASARVSMRIVPDQDAATVSNMFTEYVETVFRSFGSANTLKVSILSTGDWWLANPKDPYYNAAEQAITEVWGVKPLYVREGGSIPVTPFLEKVLGCPALHLPLGQASDQAHLQNERIRLENLLKGRDVMRLFLQKCGALRVPKTASAQKVTVF